MSSAVPAPQKSDQEPGPSLPILATVPGGFGQGIHREHGRHIPVYAPVAHFITTLIVIAAVGLASMIVWEWFYKEPIVDVPLFKNFNFASSNLMFFVVGVVLFSSTVLLPQFLQTLMGYTAERPAWYCLLQPYSCCVSCRWWGGFLRDTYLPSGGSHRLLECTSRASTLIY